MTTFTGTNADETITPSQVSPTVATDGDPLPGIDSDTIKGGGGDDTVAGGRGDDVAFLGSGDDRYLWSPGDGSDSIEGGAGLDLLDFSGSNVGEAIDIAANGSHVRFFRNVANITMDLHGVEEIAFRALGGADHVSIHDLTGTDVRRVTVSLDALAGTGDGQADAVDLSGRTSADTLNITSNGNTITALGLPWRVEIGAAESIDSLTIFGMGGDDVVKASGLSANAIQLAIEGGAGDDSIVGSINADRLAGGNGRDRIDGGKGNDIAALGTASDTYFWHAGDGDDVVDGDQGNDLLDFTASSATETINISATAGEALVQRGMAAGRVTTDNIERLFFHGNAGPDRLLISDLTATDVRRIDIDLRAGDGGADFVTVVGTTGEDNVALASNGGQVSATGLTEAVVIRNSAVNDQLAISGGVGADTIDAGDVAAGVIGLSINGGDDADLILGSHGADTVLGGRGNDNAVLGDGNDRFVWNPGDGNDVVKGQAGADTFDFFGSNVSENIDLSANGTQLRFFRNVANIVTDVGGIEKIFFHAFGGADNITVNNLSGTGVERVYLDLSSTIAGGDAQPDRVVVNGRQAADHIDIATFGTGLSIAGLPWTVVISEFEQVDALSILAGSGNDVIDASAVSTDAALRIDSGLGNDTVTGGGGADAFVFATVLNAAGNVDTIKDFAVAADTMVLASAVFAGIGAPGPLPDTAFRIGSAAADADDRIIYNAANGKLLFDSDGAGGNDAVLFARMQPGLSLTHEDFAIV